jgi:uncharacterized protein (UPF0276 family)
LPKIFSSVALNLDAQILSACLPLLEAEKVEAIEWSFDALYRHQQIPAWFTELLMAYSNENRLIGHGVFFSIFSGKWLKGQEEWLQHLQDTCKVFKFDHITEHFGFMTGKDFHQGAPLNIPYNSSVLAIGQDRLKRIYNACLCPVGLENLAFSYSPEEVKKHGEFLDRLVEPVNGFIILDLHNLYCQAENFSMDPDQLLSVYPLARVREIHISGGSWEPSEFSPVKRIRRDTHDDTVPPEVFELLEKTIPKCPQLRFVVLEQLGNGLLSEESKFQFREDFLKMEKIVSHHNKKTINHLLNPFLPTGPFQSGNTEIIQIPGMPLEDETLYARQLELSTILESSNSLESALLQLQQSSLANTDWNIENWAPSMLETAIKIAQKWK